MTGYDGKPSGSLFPFSFGRNPVTKKNPAVIVRRFSSRTSRRLHRQKNMIIIEINKVLKASMRFVENGGEDYKVSVTARNIQKRDYFQIKHAD